MVRTKSGRKKDKKESAGDSEIPADQLALAQENKTKGNVAFSAGQYMEAVKYFTQAIKHNPKDHVFYSNRSACYASLDKYKEASADALQCTTIAPGWAKGYSRLGLALFKLKEYKKALKAYETGVSIDPSNTQLLEGISEIRRTEAAEAARDEDGESEDYSDEEPELVEPGKVDHVIGIDLGTTYSCVAVWRNGEPEVLTNDEGERTTPSWVGFSDDERLVGEAAKRQAARNPTNTLFNIKRIIGRTYGECTEELKLFPFTVLDGDNGKPMVQVKAQGETKTMAPEEISAMVLEKMKKTAEAALGCEVTKAVVTVPAYFNDAQRRLTKDAGTIAGLEVLRVINEPTAAALAYGLDNATKDEATPNQTILVFDLGGGTFDVSLLSIQEGMFEVISTAGDTHLGGEDFDSALADWVAAEVKRTKKVDPFTGDHKMMRRLRNACEKAKRILSSSSGTTVDITVGDEEYSVAISKAKFESLNEKIFQRCLDAVKRCLQDGKMEKDQVDEIVLVGGSTRVPRVQAILQDYFNGKQLCKSVHPDEAVAYGAAVQGAILSGVRDPSTQSLLLVDVIPLSLGVECAGREFSKVINRNTSVPCRKTKEYSTVEDWQTEVDVRIFEGERTITDGNNLLGEFQITGIQRARAGEAKILVTFDVNHSGLLTVTAKDKVTGAEASVNINNAHGQLPPEEIERMMAEAEKFRAKDEAHAKAVREEMEREYMENRERERSGLN